MRDLSQVTDFYLIATGNNGPHLKAMATELNRALDKEGNRRHRKSGTPESGWIVSDYLNVVVHLFNRDMREHYALEKLWNDAKRLK